MDHLLQQACAQSTTIFQNAQKVNAVTQQRAPFARAAATLADQAREQAEQIVVHANSNQKVLGGSKSLIKHMLDVTVAVEEGTDLIADVEQAIVGFMSCFSRIEQFAMNISKTAQAIDVVSLIARVEAAKAVKKGKNFSVVADQVKSLAEETVNYARKIRSSVATLIESTDEMQARTTTLRTHMTQASELGHATREHLEQISIIIDNASGYAEETRLEATEQSRAMQDVSAHMQTLAQGVQSSVQGSEANMALADQVLHLLDVDEDFRQDGVLCVVPPYSAAITQAMALTQKIAANARAVNVASIAREKTASSTSELARHAQSMASAGGQRSSTTQKSLLRAAELLTLTLVILTRISDATLLVDSASGMATKLRAGFTNIEEMASRVGDISNKTNILALNASVEASQAGEEGRGFAVVAAEVNVLAASAGGYVTEIDQLGVELSGYDDRVNKSMELLTVAIEQLSTESAGVREDATQLNAVLDGAVKETSLIQELLQRQTGEMLEVIVKSEALGDDARSAIGGSAKNMELCAGLLESLTRLTPPDELSA